MTLPLISAATAAVLLALQSILMILVGARRAQGGVFIGEGQDPNLLRRIRRHGNLAENAGLFVAALTLLEMLGTAASLMAPLAGAFTTARVLHAIGFSSLAGSHGHDGSKLFAGARLLGAFGTLITGLTIAGLLAYGVSLQGLPA